MMMRNYEGVTTATAQALPSTSLHRLVAGGTWDGFDGILRVLLSLILYNI
jgi:hypothetical protein